jgi:hypothetical protein
MLIHFREAVGAWLLLSNQHLDKVTPEAREAVRQVLADPTDPMRTDVARRELARLSRLGGGGPEFGKVAELAAQPESIAPPLDAHLTRLAVPTVLADEAAAQPGLSIYSRPRADEPVGQCASWIAAYLQWRIANGEDPAAAGPAHMRLDRLEREPKTFGLTPGEVSDVGVAFLGPPDVATTQRAVLVLRVLIKRAAGSPAASVGAAGAGERIPEVCNAHSDDFRSCRWGGVYYQFSPKQAAIVEVLWRAWEDGHGVGQESVAETISADHVRKFDLRGYFRVKKKGSKGKLRTVNHQAWGVMIQPWGEGVFGLGPPPMTNGESSPR